MKKLWTGWKRIAAKIAHFQSHLLLSVIYLLILAPLGCLFRLFRQDPLNIRAKKADSYWVPRPPAPPVDEFLKKEY